MTQERTSRCSFAMSAKCPKAEVGIKEAADCGGRGSPADQVVEGDHRSKGEAGDAEEYDVKEHALHVLITATSQDGSDRTKIPAYGTAMSGE